MLPLQQKSAQPARQPAQFSEAVEARVPRASLNQSLPAHTPFDVFTSSRGLSHNARRDKL
jgi:hypothetical protein